LHEPKQPLAEVFGHLPTDKSARAQQHRKSRLCPFGNKVPNCTKDKANDPLGVCSIFHNGTPVITCPIRFRESWLIADNAASFFFPLETKWTSLTEVRLEDSSGRAAGNIDVVLVSYDDAGQVINFGALEVQAVYISGNVRRPFEHFVKGYETRSHLDWRGELHYPRPDYLSSSRKRLAPQLLFKGGILHSWGKRLAVAMNQSFFSTLPPIEQVPEDHAEIAWLLYDLRLCSPSPEGFGRYELTRVDTVYTKFSSALRSITTPSPGNVEDFVRVLQAKLDEQLETPPNTRTIEEPSEHE